MRLATGYTNGSRSQNRFFSPLKAYFGFARAYSACRAGMPQLAISARETVSERGLSEKRASCDGHVCVRRMSRLQTAGEAVKAERAAEVKWLLDAGRGSVDVNASRSNEPPNVPIFRPEERVRMPCLPGRV